MRISVKLFGPEATACGVDSVDLDVADGTGPDVVLRSLAELRPELRASIGSLRLAINHEFARPDQTITPSDELALIGLVSGG